ncbi:MAG: caspase family protein [Sedimentisphaerales bacterium]|nr:caspase family protein [Sedimentisphaerales bacterium]
MKHWKRQKESGSPRSVLRLESLDSRVLLSAGVYDDFGDNYKSAALVEHEDPGLTTIESDIYSYKDKDYISFTALGSGKLILSLDTSDSDLIPIVTVYNGKMKKMSSTNWRLHDDVSEVAILVEEGEKYTVGIRSVRKTYGDYVISIDGPQTGQLWTEDYGNSKYEAELLSETKSVAGEILNQSRNDKDYFSFYAQSNGQVTIDVIPQDNTLDANVAILNSRGKTVAKSNAGGLGATESITINVEAGQLYYVKTVGVSRTQGLYSLELSGTGLDPEGEISQAYEAKEYENCYAVLVGASEYDRAHDLAETELDVQLMQQALTEAMNVDPANIMTLTGNKYSVNSSTIENALSWLDANTGPGDLALFYYSGHGDYGRSVVKDDNETLYLPSGDDITELELRAMLSKFDADTTKLVIIDSCYSGGFAQTADYIPNTAVLASSQFNQISWGYVERFNIDAAKGSVFTSLFAEGLMENKVSDSAIDTNSDGKVSFGEAFILADTNANFYTGKSWSVQDPLARMRYGDIIL